MCDSSASLISQAQIYAPNQELLTFSRSADVDGRVAVYGDKKMDIIFYQITFRTTPNDAVYEATVEYSANFGGFHNWSQSYQSVECLSVGGILYRTQWFSFEEILSLCQIEWWSLLINGRKIIGKNSVLKEHLNWRKEEEGGVTERMFFKFIEPWSRLGVVVPGLAEVELVVCPDDGLVPDPVVVVDDDDELVPDPVVVVDDDDELVPDPVVLSMMMTMTVCSLMRWMCWNSSFGWDLSNNRDSDWHWSHPLTVGKRWSCCTFHCDTRLPFRTDRWPLFGYYTSTSYQLALDQQLRDNHWRMTIGSGNSSDFLENFVKLKTSRCDSHTPEPHSHPSHYRGCSHRHKRCKRNNSQRYLRPTIDLALCSECSHSMHQADDWCIEGHYNY